ncbi:MAG TPA: DUF4886 domain-containing protein [Sphingobacterium sp.]|nr:DUF4886 domain-containing protein [Sphingobacterium sp.]
MQKKISTLLMYVFFLFIGSGEIVFAQQSDSPQGDKVVRVLAIGNSFSQDGIENYLHELAEAAGIKMIIGNLYIGGASLALHVDNIRGDKAKYSYRKIGANGEKNITPDTKISDVLSEEKWDFISLQQVSGFSGKLNSYEESLPELYAYVLEHVSNPEEVRMVLHQTWAYQQDSDHKNFANYNNDQSQMYEAISSTSEKVLRLENFDRIVPAGTAIQNARTSYIGDHYTRDGYHLELNYGRFTAACAWFETLFGKDVRKNTFIPASVTEIEAKISKEAAHQAVLNPFEISELLEFQVEEATESN